VFECMFIGLCCCVSACVGVCCLSACVLGFVVV